jgi:hypothetical protein
LEATRVSLIEFAELRDIDLSENDEKVKSIFRVYDSEVEVLTNLDDGQISELISKTLSNDDPSYKLVESNLLYLKQSYFILQKEKQLDEMDISILKELKVSEILDAEGLEKLSRKTDLSVDFGKLERLVAFKFEEEEKYKDYNVVSTIASKFEMPETKIKFISKLSEYISFVSELDNAVNYVSRGQKDCSFDLLPSLHRRFDRDYEIHSDIYEGAFKQKIIYYDKEIKNKSGEEIRAEGQHFGLPTDYLDFTEAHLISLLFAIEDYNYKNQHSIVFFIDSLAYNKDAVSLEEKLLDYSVPTVVDSMRRYSARSYFIKLGNSNERIHFQKGCFLKVSPQDREDLKRRLSNFCKIVIINKDSKKVILKELFNLGITFENIYPDKDNVVKSIKFYYEEMMGGYRG